MNDTSIDIKGILGQSAATVPGGKANEAPKCRSSDEEKATRQRAELL
jgi:hypothetical protein